MHATETAIHIRTCCHIFPDHHRCGSPALRNEPFCYFHDPARHANRQREARNRRRSFAVATPSNRSELKLSLDQVIQGLAHNQLDPRRAGLLLFALQIAATRM
jgi:hypothetical protein